MTPFITLFLLFLPLSPSIVYAADSDEPIDTPESEQLFKGQPMIFMDEERQKRSGLKIIKTQATLFKPEIIAYGQAINISPLLSTRSHYLSAIAQQDGFKARFTQAEKNISRLRKLHKNEVISTKKLQKQLSDWHSVKAMYDKNIYQSQLIINNSKLQWGELLTLWATKKNSPQFDKLINGELTLLQVTLPPAAQPLLSHIEKIFISPTGTRSTAVEASFVCILPQVNNISQGVQYIFLSKATKIKAGMNFSAWLPQKQQKQQGVIIPGSSLAWHLGQSFVFIRIDAEYFVHRNILNPIKTHDGYYVGEQITKGEELVITGAPMLLSHEFRSQIQSEADDDD